MATKSISGKTSRKQARQPIFEGIRKPLAPPGHPMSRAKPEPNSIGNLLLHLGGNARQWIVSGLGGETDRRVRQREFDERTMISSSELLSRLRETLGEVDTVLANFDGERILDQHRIQDL